MLSLVAMYVDSLREREGATDSVWRVLTFGHQLSEEYPHHPFRHTQHAEHHKA